MIAETPLARAGGAGRRLYFLAATGIAAAAVGALATTTPKLAIAAVSALVIVVLIATRTSFLVLLLVAMMFVESLSLGGGLHVGRLAGGVAVLVVVYLLLSKGTAGLRQNGLVLAAGAYGAWMLLSVYWAASAGEVMRQLFSYGLALAYTLAFALLVRSRSDLRSILGTLAVGALVFGAVALATFLASGGTARASGLQGDPNYFSEYQVIALPAVLCLASFESRRRRRLALYAVAAVIVLSVVASQSRGGFLALLLIVAASIFAPWRLFFRTAGERRLYATAIGVAATVVVLLGSATLFNRAGSIFHPSADRGAGRLDLWSAAWQGWKQHPWLGLGEGNYRVHALDLLQTTPGVNTAAQYVFAGREVHNAYLETLTELGPVGLLLFFAVIGATGHQFLVVFRRARRARDDGMMRVAVALLCSLTAYTVTAFFLSTELQKPLWILVGIALALDVMYRRAPSAARS